MLLEIQASFLLGVEEAGVVYKEVRRERGGSRMGGVLLTALLALMHTAQVLVS